MNIDQISTLEHLIHYVIDLLDPSTLRTIKDCSTEDEFIGLAHHSLGMSLRNHLELWVNTSHLYNFFKTNYGLLHADDMSGILMAKLYRVLKGDLSNDWIDAEIAHYRQHWENSPGGNSYVIPVVKGP